jgi:putative ABC transport system permease protein
MGGSLRAIELRRMGTWIESAVQDVRYALRSLQRRLSFTLIVIVSLALGIGVNTAIFSVAHAVLLRPLPYPDPDRLVVISEELAVPYIPGAPFPPTVDYFSHRDLLKSFEGVMGMGDAGNFKKLVGVGEPQELSAGPVAARMCAIFKVKPLFGRCFTEEEEAQEAPVALLSYGLWQSTFGGDKAILGRTMTFRDEPRDQIYTIVGVMPQGFRLYSLDYDLWTPVPPDGNFIWGTVVGRLKPGIDIRQAQTEASLVQQQVLPQDHEGLGGRRVIVRPLLEHIGRSTKTGLSVLLAASALVLLITCVNIANLLLSRTTVRLREMAMRESLGAGRMRVCRQLLTESLVLASLGGALGLLAAHWLVKGVRIVAFGRLPRLDELQFDWGIWLFAVSISFLTGLLSGILPALRLSIINLADTMKAGGESAIGGKGHQRVMNTLLVFQTAICVVAMMGAGLLINTVVRLKSIDPGVVPQQALTVRILAPRAESAVAFIGEVLERVRAVPGVEAAGTVNIPPLSGFSTETRFRLAASPGGVYPLEATSSIVSPDYFKAIGTRLVQGRSFDNRDTQDSLSVVVVSESLARKHWPGRNPLGQRIAVAGRTEERVYEVIGVAADVRNVGLRELPMDQIYTTYAQGTSLGTRLVVRTQNDPAAFARAVKDAIRTIDSEQTLDDFATLETALAEQIEEPRFYMLLLGAFGVLALLLTALGIGGSVAHAVSRRTREIGVRVCFGATPGALLKMFGTNTLVLVAAGIVFGALGALAVTRYTGSLLYEITPTDPATFGAVVLILLGAALSATTIAAGRALLIDPAQVLREE